ncbi:MAG: hypothetical protein AAF432_06505 [Planctomycetota bacterium]
MLAAIEQPGIWLIVIAAMVWFGMMALKIVGIDLNYALSWHHLRIQAHTLRLEQHKRLQAMILAARGGVEPDVDLVIETEPDATEEDSTRAAA